MPPGLEKVIPKAVWEHVREQMEVFLRMGFAEKELFIARTLVDGQMHWDAYPNAICKKGYGNAESEN